MPAGLSEGVRRTRARKVVLVGLGLVCVTWLGAGQAAGQPITSPAALNTNADVDNAEDIYPQVATDGLGKWVVVWQHEDPL